MRVSSTSQQLYTQQQQKTEAAQQATTDAFTQQIETNSNLTAITFIDKQTGKNVTINGSVDELKEKFGSDLVLQDDGSYRATGKAQELFGAYWSTYRKLEAKADKNGDGIYDDIDYKMGSPLVPDLRDLHSLSSDGMSVDDPNYKYANSDRDLRKETTASSWFGFTRAIGNDKDLDGKFSMSEIGERIIGLDKSELSTEQLIKLIEEMKKQNQDTLLSNDDPNSKPIKLESLLQELEKRKNQNNPNTERLINHEQKTL